MEAGYRDLLCPKFRQISPRFIERQTSGSDMDDTGGLVEDGAS